jgi:hypothetical protein
MEHSATYQSFDLRLFRSTSTGPSLCVTRLTVTPMNEQPCESLTSQISHDIDRQLKRREYFIDL